MRLLHVLLMLCCSATNAAGLAVVVNRDSAVDNLSMAEVRSIFLGKTNRLPNGERAHPMEINDSTLRQQFYEQISGKSLNQLNSYWATLLFTGKGRPPQVLKGMDDVLESLPGEPGAITYLPVEEVTDTMKVVYTDP